MSYIVAAIEGDHFLPGDPGSSSRYVHGWMSGAEDVNGWGSWSPDRTKLAQNSSCDLADNLKFNNFYF